MTLPRGLKIRPIVARQRIPVIQPGQSWTTAFRVKPTETTKRRSSITFVAGLGALTARNSVVARFAG